MFNEIAPVHLYAGVPWAEFLKRIDRLIAKKEHAKAQMFIRAVSLDLIPEHRAQIMIGMQFVLDSIVDSEPATPPRTTL